MNAAGDESDAATDSIVDREHLLGGLQHLGLRRTSGRSVLHLCSRQLPSGMYDGHRSAMVAPDHLLFQGLTKRLITATF